MGKWLNEAREKGNLVSPGYGYAETSLNNSTLPEVEFVIDNRPEERLLIKCPYVLPRIGEVIEISFNETTNIHRYLVKGISHVYSDRFSLSPIGRITIEVTSVPGSK